MGALVRGDQHTRCQQIFDPLDAQRPVWNAVRASIADLQARRRVMEAVHQNIVREVPAFDNIFVGDIIVAANYPAAADMPPLCGPIVLDQIGMLACSSPFCPVNS